MKKYPFLEAIGTVDEKFLEEALDDSKEQERRQISMNKRKTVTILIAAALIFAMAATAVAAGISKISTLGSYFDDTKEHFKLEDKVPTINNPQDYANEVTTEVTTTAQSEDVNGVVNAIGTVDTYAPPKPGEAKITAVSATKRSLYLTYEFNAAGLDIPQELPEDARSGEEYMFEWADVNLKWSGGKGGTISRDGDIFTGILHWNNIFELPEDEIVIKLQRFGYTAIEGIDKVHKTIADIEVEMRLPMNQINVMESIKSKNTAKVMGAESTAELSAYELIIYSDAEELSAAGYDFSMGWGGEGKNPTEYYLKTVLEFHMLDGTVFTEHLFTNEFETSHIVGNMSGFKDNENGLNAKVLSFEVPLDVSQIDYIMINDARFDFAH